MNQDSQMRKCQLTINNPQEKGYNHDRIKQELDKLKSCIYWIMGDEIGGKDGTYHTHIYAVFRTPVRFSTLKNRFPVAHIERTTGTHKSNIEYVKKIGKWKDTDKGATSVANTIEEWGECPPEANGTDEHLAQLYQYIKDGLSNYEIIEKSTDYLFDTDKIDRVRLLLKKVEYEDKWRDLQVTYIWGKTGLGKSRYVMEKYGYKNVYRVTNYSHFPFDTYKGEDVCCFEEFNSSFRMSDILNYIDGYPLILPARYSDKVACYTKVYICSNLPLEKQYENIRQETPDVWYAFIRRIGKVMWFKKDRVITYDSTDEYFDRDLVTGNPVKRLEGW